MVYFFKIEKGLRNRTFWIIKKSFVYSFDNLNQFLIMLFINNRQNDGLIIFKSNDQ